MRVLIIGGNRFFGRKLAAMLIAQHHVVTLMNRQNIDDGFADRVRRIRCDRSDRRALQSAIGASTWDVVYDQACFDAASAQAACDVFRGRTGHYVFTSSQAVYASGAFIREDQFDPGCYQLAETAGASTSYAEGKRQCEAIFFSQHDFPVTSVRLSIVVGTDDYTGRLQWHINRIKARDPIFIPNPNARISLIDSGDAAMVLCALATKPVSAAINAASPEAIRLSNLIGAIESVVGSKSVLPDTGDEINHSPYGIDGDWFMDTRKLGALQIHVRPVTAWLTDLIRQLARDGRAARA